MIAKKGNKVYVVDDQPGRAGSFNSSITLWENPRDAVLVFLVGNRGHTNPDSPHGRELMTKHPTWAFRNPEYPDNIVETDEDEVTRLAIKLEHQGNLSKFDLLSQEDQDDEDYEDEDDEDDGYCSVSSEEVR